MAPTNILQTVALGSMPCSMSPIPLPWIPGGIDVAEEVEESSQTPGPPKPLLFDTIDYDAMDRDSVPECPPPEDDYSPTSMASTPESGFIDEEEEDVQDRLAELIPGLFVKHTTIKP